MNKKQTPLQKAIERFDYANPLARFTSQEIVDYLQSLLPEERQMVVDAWEDGETNWTKESMCKDASNYFTLTYEEQTESVA